jgi:hypothetical protein
MRRSDNGSDWHAEETYKGLIQISLSGLRFAVFANGGAAVALLAFLGGAGNANLSLSAAKTAMGMFVVGVALGGFAHITAYLTQLRLYGESALGDPQKGFFRHNVFLWLTLVLVLTSVALFLSGAWCGVSGFQASVPN